MMNRHLALLFATVVICGCSQERVQVLPPPPPPPPVVVEPVRPDSKYDREDLDSLMAYTAEISKMSSAERLVECRQLLTLHKAKPTPAARLHLLMMQTITGSCGSFRGSLTGLQNMQGSLADTRVANFLVYQQAMIKQLDKDIARKRNTLKVELSRTRKEAQKIQEKTQERMQSRDSELKLLQDKLDALKSIEQDLGDAPEEATP